jgi:hypothetical protein
LRRVLVPFHMFRLGDRIVGMDAYFWRHLSKRYRVVLLVHPSQNLQQPGEVEGCRLPVEVTAEEQLSDIEDVASMPAASPSPPKPSLAKRLLTLLMPASLLYYELREGMRGFRVPEEAQARGLARILRDRKPEPLGYMSYAVFRVEGENLILPETEGGMRRIYSELASRDEGYREACRRAIEMCRW